MKDLKKKSPACGRREQAKWEKPTGAEYSKQPRVKTRGIAASGYACPTSSDNFIYGFTPVELRQNIKWEMSGKN